MSNSVPAEPVRIGHDERRAAVEALKQHHAAGRIDPQEYEDRSVKAERAQIQSDLDVLFTDLPQPHYGQPGAASPGALTTGTPVTGAPVKPVVARRGGVLNIDEPWATTLVSLTPILGVILFFVTGSWLWFLAVPVVALLVYGPDGRQDVGPEAALRRRRDKE